MKRICCYIFPFIVLLVSCSSQKQIARQGVSSIKLIGEYSLPHKMNFKGTVVGGLSSIDYSPSEDIYYMICDDRSDYNPARYYTAKIIVSTNGIDSVQLTSVTTLLQKNGEAYPNRTKDPLQVPDPEAMRLNQKNGTLVWSSEGERIVRNGTAIIMNPSVNSMSKDGRLTDTFSLPPNMHMHATENGPRQNGVFEGLSFADDFKTLYVSVEEPLYEDGHRAGLHDSTGWIRIIKYNTERRLPVAQYAYPIDAVVKVPVSPAAFVVNGVPDILAVNDHQLIVIERSFSTGHTGCNVRVYLADMDAAEDVAQIPSVHKKPSLQYMKKKLLLNMDQLGRFIDNIEGVTFGPRLPNGKQSLVFIADDNFSPSEKNQFLLFEVN